jgi:type 1 fimbria pilin
VSRKKVAAGLIAGMAMAMAAAAAETPSGTGTVGATFVNSSKHHVTIYTRFGADGSCEAQPKEQVVSLDPQQTVSVDSGGGSVCFCARVPENRACPSGWITVKPGGTRHLM